MPKSDALIIFVLLSEIVSLKKESPIAYNILDKIIYKDKAILSRHIVESRFGSYRKLLNEYTNNDAVKEFIESIRRQIAILKEKYR